LRAAGSGYWQEQRSLEREGAISSGGKDRTDDVFTLDLTGQINPSLSATLSVENRRSSIDLFSGATFSLDLNLLSLQF
jgi:hypothetical protein